MKKLLYMCVSFIISTNLFSQELITQENIHEVVDAWFSNPYLTEAQYGHISDWDVSNVTNLSYLFDYATIFNEDISNWDVSSVTNMNSMFRYATSFNQDLSSWDVSNVINMSSMFNYATSFDQDLLENGSCEYDIYGDLPHLITKNMKRP